jgi:hypothetical protein
LSSFVWIGLAIVFGALAIASTKHYYTYRSKLDDLLYKNIKDKVTPEYKKFIEEEIGSKSEAGLQGRLLATMIPIEVVGFLVAMIGAVLTYCGL